MTGVTEKAHAKLSPSGSARWLNCPGSVAVHEDSGSSFADEGTVAHSLAELILRTIADSDSGIRTPDEFVGMTFPDYEDIPVTQEMSDYVWEYVDYVLGLGGEQSYEVGVSFNDWVPDGDGTSDVIVIDNKTLIVGDLKYGKGVMVSAYYNTQGMFYALGALSEYELTHEFDKVKIIIHQPRLDHISVWETTPDELYTWADEVVRPAALLADSEEGPRVPGEKQCQWCSFAARCPERKDQVEAAIMECFDDLELQGDVTTVPDQLDDEALQQAMNVKKLVVSWFQAVEDLIVERLKDGQPFPGYKLVEGRSNRTWADKEQAERKLKRLLGAKNAYTKALLTPPAAEKVLGKKRIGEIEKLIVKPQGSPTLAPIEDPRPAIEVITVDDFEEIEDEF